MDIRAKWRGGGKKKNGEREGESHLERERKGDGTKEGKGGGRLDVREGEVER